MQFTTKQYLYHKFLHETIKENQVWSSPHETGFLGRRYNIDGYINGLKPITQGYIIMYPS